MIEPCGSNNPHPAHHYIADDSNGYWCEGIDQPDAKHDPLVVASVTVSRVFVEGHDEVSVIWEPEEITMVEALGMLRLAEDTVIADRMGRTNDK